MAQIDTTNILSTYSYPGGQTPESGSATWKLTDWSVGQSITEDLMDNQEKGLGIAFKWIDAILEELGSASPEETSGKIALRNSRIDAILNEIGGSFNKDTAILQGSTRIDDLEKEIGGSRSEGNGYTNSNIDKLKNQVTAIVNEIGGTGSNGSNTTYSGTSRIDNIQKWITGAENNKSYDNANSVTDRLNAIVKELGIAQETTSGGQTTETIQNGAFSAQSHIDTLIKLLYGTTYNSTNNNFPAIAAKGTTLKSILDWLLEPNTNGGYKEYDYTKGSIAKRLNDIESDDNKFNARINTIAAELGASFNNQLGHENEFNNGTHIDHLLQIIYGSSVNSGSNSIPTINTSIFNGLLTWILGAPTNNTYANYENANSISARLNLLENARNTLANQIGILNNDGTSISNSRIDALMNYVFGNTSIPNQTITNMAGIMTWLVGANNTNYNTDFGTIANRLKALEEEIGIFKGNSNKNQDWSKTKIDYLVEAIGSYNESNGTFTATTLNNFNTRLTNIENNSSAALKEWLIGANKETYNATTTRAGTDIDNYTPGSIAERVAYIEKNFSTSGQSTISTNVENLMQEVYGNSTTTDPSRIKSLINEVYDVNNGTIPSSGSSRLDTLNTKVNTLETQIANTGGKQIYITASNTSASDIITIEEPIKLQETGFIRLSRNTVGTANLQVRFTEEENTIRTLTLLNCMGETITKLYPANLILGINRISNTQAIVISPTLVI